MYSIFCVLSIVYLVVVNFDSLIDAQTTEIVKENTISPNENNVSATALAGCLWIRHCAITCSSMEYEFIEESVMYLINEVPIPNCNMDGVNLKLGVNITYPDNVFPANFFFNNAIPLMVLHINFEGITIGRNSFTSTVFSRIHDLIIENAKLRMFSKYILRGLTRLTVLEFKYCSINQFEIGAFDSIATTLSFLNIIQKPNHNEMLQSNFLSIEMRVLLQMEFVTNMRNSITNETFQATPNVWNLYLSDCQIETIGPNSFDMLHSLQILELKNNKLKNIPNELFDKITRRSTLRISLEKNPWICDCDICYVKTLFRYNFHFYFDKDVCRTPDKHISDHVSERCNDRQCYKILPQSLQCHQNHYDKIIELDDILKGRNSFQIHESPDRSLILRLVQDAFDNHFIVWFDISNQSGHFQDESTTVNYYSRLGHMSHDFSTNNSFYMVNIMSNIPYTFCLTKKISEEYVVSDFNCISYSKTIKYDEAWLFNNMRNFIIGMIVLSFFVLIILGILLGYILFCRYPSWLRGSRNVVIVRSASERSCTREHEISSDKYRRTSDVYEPPSRFEIVLRQLEHEGVKRRETCSTISNDFELSSQIPIIETPSCPASCEILPIENDSEPENYYCSAEFII